MQRKTGLLLTLWLLVAWADVGRADEKADVAAIISRAIGATGGANRLKRLRAATWTVKGKYYEPGTPVEFTQEWARELPDRARITTRGRTNDRQFEIISVFNEGTGWIKENGKTHAMSPQEIAENVQAMYVADLARLVTLRRQGIHLTALGDATCARRPAAAVKVVGSGHGDVTLYFDKGNGLLVKSAGLAHDNRTGKEVLEETLYSDQREVDGLKLPFAVAIRRDGQPYADGVVQQYHLAEALDPALFKKP